MHPYVGGFDIETGPCERHNFAVGEDLSVILHESDKDIEGAAAYGKQIVASQENPRSRIQAIRPEAEVTVFTVRSHFGSPQWFCPL
ncbi:hypothetical protein GCM10010520_17570 [Rhizobium viscosum]